MYIYTMYMYILVHMHIAWYFTHTIHCVMCAINTVHTDLLYLAVSREVAAHVHPRVLPVQHSEREEEANERVILRGIDDELVADLIFRHVLSVL